LLAVKDGNCEGVDDGRVLTVDEGNREGLSDGRWVPVDRDDDFEKVAVRRLLAEGIGVSAMNRFSGPVGRGDDIVGSNNRVSEGVKVLVGVTEDARERVEECVSEGANVFVGVTEDVRESVDE